MFKVRITTVDQKEYAFSGHVSLECQDDTCVARDAQRPEWDAIKIDKVQTIEFFDESFEL